MMMMILMMIQITFIAIFYKRKESSGKKSKHEFFKFMQNSLFIVRGITSLSIYLRHLPFAILLFSYKIFFYCPVLSLFKKKFLSFFLPFTEICFLENKSFLPGSQN